MTLVRFQPNQDLERAQRRFRKVFSPLFDDFSNALQHGFEMGSYIPRADLSEDEKNQYITLELPGLKSEDIKLTVSDGVLTIRGEKKRSEEVSKQNFHRIERHYGEFVRQFALPENLSEDIKAAFNDGVLSLTIAKVEPAKPKEREIKIAGSKPANPSADANSSVN